MKNVTAGYIATALLSAGSSFAQCTWQQIHTAQPGTAQYGSMAYDSAGSRCIMLATSPSQYNETFERVGSQWRLINTLTRYEENAMPTALGAMVYDAARAKTVLFGTNGTWTFSSGGWVHLLGLPDGEPIYRQLAAMACDSDRQRIVLFGGGYPSGPYWSDTWEWDGSSWSERAVPGPAARVRHCMAYDSGRHRTVLFGGSAASNATFGDTWEWDGLVWTQRSSTGPQPRFGAAMAYDSARARTVLFGGNAGSDLGDTWEWDGSTWTPRVVTGPSARYGSNMVFDSSRQRTVLYGGAGGQTDTWEWNGVAWTQVGPTDPSPRANHAMAYDSDLQRTVLFGGLAPGPNGTVNGETWFWSGSAWSRGPNGPDPRQDAAMAYDQARHQVVLFGGRALQSPVYGDTWLLTGSTWTQGPIYGGPMSCWGHAMAYDPQRQRVVLFGGHDPFYSYLNDTYEWDGQAWRAIPVTNSPSPRVRHMMTYDAHLGRIVLVGGMSDAGVMGDTWEYDGTTWRPGPEAGYATRYSAGLAYEPATQRTVLYGGNRCCPSTPIWDYDGAAWNFRRETAFSRTGPMVYDTARSCFVLFDGWTGAFYWSRGDTLELPSGDQPIVIDSQPADQAVNNRDTVVFTTSVSGQGPFTYQWWHRRAVYEGDSWIGIINGPGGAAGNLPNNGGGIVTGADTPTLTITHATPSDMDYGGAYWGGAYLCTISNGCTTVATRTASLTVSPCSADFDGDGEMGTNSDIEAFFSCLAGNCCLNCLTADFNGDGDAGTDADIESFFRVLSGGPC